MVMFEYYVFGTWQILLQYYNIIAIYIIIHVIIYNFSSIYNYEFNRFKLVAI